MLENRLDRPKIQVNGINLKKNIKSNFFKKKLNVNPLKDGIL